MHAEIVDYGAVFESRAFLTHLRYRMRLVTAGLRGGVQRLDLAIEAFWNEALQAPPLPPGSGTWRSLQDPEHPLHAAVAPVQRMLQTELSHVVTAAPAAIDALGTDLLQALLEIAHLEASFQGEDETQREVCLRWLSSQLAALRVQSCAAAEPSMPLVGRQAA